MHLSLSLSSPDEDRRYPLSDDVRYVCRNARIMETWFFMIGLVAGEEEEEEGGGGEGGEKRL